MDVLFASIIVLEMTICIVSKKEMAICFHYLCSVMHRRKFKMDGLCFNYLPSVRRICIFGWAELQQLASQIQGQSYVDLSRCRCTRLKEKSASSWLNSTMWYFYSCTFFTFEENCIDFLIYTVEYAAGSFLI